MAEITKEDLKWQNQYSWDSSHLEEYEKLGFPDEAILNRSNGCEVISVVNVVLRKLKINDKSIALEIEKLIHYKMPKFIRSRQTAIFWLRDQLQGQL